MRGKPTMEVSSPASPRWCCGVGCAISLTLAIPRHPRKGARAALLLYPDHLSPCQQGRSALVCFLGEMLCLLYPALQLVRSRARSPILVAPGPVNSPATGGQRGEEGGHLYPLSYHHVAKREGMGLRRATAAFIFLVSLMCMIINQTFTTQSLYLLMGSRWNPPEQLRFPVSPTRLCKVIWG